VSPEAREGMDERDREVVAALRAALDAEARGHALSPRLAAARRQALAGRRSLRPAAWGLAGLATAAAGVLGLVLWLGGPHGASGPARVAEPTPMAAADDLDLLASGEGVDFYADLDFYLWLAQDGNAG
jgi:hypothetical protein